MGKSHEPPSIDLDRARLSLRHPGAWELDEAVTAGGFRV